MVCISSLVYYSTAEHSLRRAFSVDIWLNVKKERTRKIPSLSYLCERDQALASFQTDQMLSFRQLYFHPDTIVLTAISSTLLALDESVIYQRNNHVLCLDYSPKPILVDFPGGRNLPAGKQGHVMLL